jgi:hypothetical protein
MTPLKTTGVIQAATTIHAAETVMGGEIQCGGYDTLVLWLDYTKGDETSVAVIPKLLRVSSGTEYQLQDWTAAAGAKTVTANSFVMSATGNHYIILDVRGIEIVKFYEDATGGTPTGTLAAAYTMTRDG